MLTIWIIHRDARARAALARIAGAGESTVLGAPGDRIFESASSPEIVMLGLAGDFEQELEFVHRFEAKLGGTSWILLPARQDLPEARRLFDTLPAQYVCYPPDQLELRRALRGALQHRSADPLSSRREREGLRARFARWFADLEVRELMRAIDPRLSTLPLLIRGEVGTGRALLARYVHTFGGNGDERFVRVGCRDAHHADALLKQIAEATLGQPAGAWTIWLEEVDCLPLPLQRTVQDWIEFGLPEGALRASRVRWIAGAGDEDDLDADPGLDPRLARALAGLTVTIPPLRERTGAIEAFVSDTTMAWCDDQGERLRHFSPDAIAALRDYPWPGNLHELESLVTRTLSFSSADPLLPVHLRFAGDNGWLDIKSERVADREADSEEEIDEADLPEALILGPEDLIDEESGFGGFEQEGEEEEDVDEEPEFIDTGEPVLRPAESIVKVTPRADAGPTPVRISRADAIVEAPFISADELAESAAEAHIGRSSDAAPGAEREAAESDLRRLILAVAHEIRNPLVSIKTFSELLPEHYDDDEFRRHFRELVGQDIDRIEAAITRLQHAGEANELKSEPVDVAHLLENLLDERRDEVQQRRLLVLRELDHSLPYALGDPIQLRDAFTALLARALARVPDRGDIYIASKYHGAGASGRPMLRILLRHTGRPGSTDAPQRADVDLVLAQASIQAMGGTLTADAGESKESVIVVDLPAPS